MTKSIAAAIVLLTTSGITSGIASGIASAHDLETTINSETRTAAEKARDQYRHPKETLEFFGVKPGMTVVDTLPGGYYGKILAPYIGEDGHYIAAQYSRTKIGEENKFTPEEMSADLEEFRAEFAKGVSEWTDHKMTTNAFRIWEASEDLYGTVDAYLFFRALHHLNKYTPVGLDNTATEAFKLVKAGGFVGVVQHATSEEESDDWAKGNSGYMKVSRVVDAFTKAGFVLETSSDINANPKDDASSANGDIVWRLPPALAFKEKDREKYLAIGESNRMTLRFRKPE